MFFYLKCIIFMYLGTGSTNHGAYEDIRGQLCGIFLSFHLYRFSWDGAQVFRLVRHILLPAEPSFWTQQIGLITSSIPNFIFETRVSCLPAWPLTHYVEPKMNLNFLPIFLPPPPEAKITKIWTFMPSFVSTFEGGCLVFVLKGERHLKDTAGT